jgi:hypothetical protein
MTAMIHTTMIASGPPKRMSGDPTGHQAACAGRGAERQTAGPTPPVARSSPPIHSDSLSEASARLHDRARRQKRALASFTRALSHSSTNVPSVATMKSSVTASIHAPHAAPPCSPSPARSLHPSWPTSSASVPAKPPPGPSLPHATGATTSPAARPAAEAHPSDDACPGARRRAGLPTVLHAADHADLPHPALDLGRPVGNEAVLAVERLCARVRVGHPQRRRLLRIDDRLQ